MGKIRKKEIAALPKKKKMKEVPSAQERKGKWQDFIQKHAATKQHEEENNIL